MPPGSSWTDFYENYLGIELGKPSLDGSSVVISFLSGILIGEDCWVWCRYKDRDGYGKFPIGQTRREYAHRFSFALFRGCIPEGLSVLHTCDNTSCVRPSHLYLGTQKDNVHDALKRNRRPHTYNSRGIQVGDVLEIKEAFSRGESQHSIARRYNVCPSTIWYTIHKRLEG